MTEGLVRREEITNEQALADLLNAEQKTLRECHVYLAWLNQRMARIQEISKDDAGGREEEEFRLILEDARIRAQGGRVQSARIAYEDALYNARHSNNTKIKATVAQIENEMKALPDGKGVTRHPDDR